MVETKRHGDAFDYYYSLGKERSYAKVGQELGVSKTSVEKWGRQFNWQLRITQRDVEINRKTEEKTNKAIVNTKADYRADIHLTLQPVMAVINTVVVINEETKKPEVKLDIDNPKDFALMIGALEKLVKLDLQLIGEDVPDRSDLNIKLELPEGWDVEKL